jgi:uncharacterized RDD family membrane protein YckC
MDSIYYPRLLRRVQAILIDSLVIALLIYTIAFLPPMGEWSFIKPLLFVVGIFILEPGLVSFTGGTIGHHWLKIRVTRLSGHGNINLFAATIRFVLKTALGWFSLAMVLTTRRHQALHDLVAKSLVVYETTDHLPAFEKLVDRPSLGEIYVMPSRWRRVLVTLTYFTTEYLIYVGITMLFVSNSCLMYRHCSTLDTFLLVVGEVAWMFGICATFVFGCRGQLYGCMRKTKAIEL